MSYYTQKQIDEFDKKKTKGNKFKRVKWFAYIKNPINGDILKTGKYCSLKEISNDNSFLPYDTWRNIAVGRSNVYDPFIMIDKNLERDLFYCNIVIGEEDEKSKPPTNESEEPIVDK